MIKIIPFTLAIFLLAVSGFLIYKAVQPKHVHYHAGFKVFINGKVQDFSSVKYMSLIPCGISGDSKVEQLEKAHLHDEIGDVVHIHRDNARWSDLFKNIHFYIDSSLPIEAYINGKKADNIFNKKIGPYESLVLLIGTHTDVRNYIRQGVVKSYIQSVEKKSEGCEV